MGYFRFFVMVSCCSRLFPNPPSVNLAFYSYSMVTTAISSAVSTAVFFTGSEYTQSVARASAGLGLAFSLLPLLYGGYLTCIDFKDTSIRSRRMGYVCTSVFGIWAALSLATLLGTLASIEPHVMFGLFLAHTILSYGTTILNACMAYFSYQDKNNPTSWVKAIYSGATVSYEKPSGNNKLAETDVEIDLVIPSHNSVEL